MNISAPQQQRQTTAKGEPFYLFRAAGSDYDIGLAKGREMAADILAAWDLFKPNMDAWTRGRPEETCEWLRRNLELHIPWMGEQIRGMADGSGISEDTVMVLNHYGVLWSGGGLFCSSVAVRETEVGPVLGQNLDIGSDDIYFVEELRPADGFATLSDGMAGMCWSPTGVNERGLAVASSMLGSPRREGARPVPRGFPFHFLPRLVIRHCADVPEAIQYLKELTPTIPPGGGYQLNLLDSAGNMAVVDKIEESAVVRQRQDGMNFTTNFSLDAELENWRTGGGETEPNHAARARNIMDRHRAAQGSLSLQWLIDTMRGHEGDGRLCRHGTEDTGGGGYSRLSFLYYPRERRAEITNGRPCCNEYQEFKLETPARGA
ncbi:MAG: C45 family peptidase [Armatimonadota bacterium]|nr:C45 family peptidase [Armatimonadota bacterium]